jgi:hypothetical protein
MYKKLITLVSKIQQDKLLHIDVCFVISFFIVKAISPLVGLIASLVIANIIIILIGYLKEKKDSKEPDNVFDSKDIIADVVGSIIGSLFAIV